MPLIYHVFLAMGVGMNLFVLTQLIRSSKVRTQPQAFAIAIIVLWTLRFILFIFKFEPSSANYPFLFLVDQHFFLLDGVLLWFYSRSLVEHVKLTFLNILHFVPFTLGVTAAAVSSIFYRQEAIAAIKQSLESFSNNEPIVTPSNLIFILILLFVAVIYFVKSVRVVKKYDISLFDNYSNAEDYRANWIITFQRLWVIFFIIPFIIYFINYIHPILNMDLLGFGLIISLLLLSFFFDSNVLNQSYSDAEKPARRTAQEKPILADPTKAEQLKELLQEHKYYEDEKLSLVQLAEYMDVKPPELTELIKQTEFDNFYDLVNTYRLEAVKQELKSTDEQVMIVAYNNGFNSKSTFNKIFKEKTGMTPREYRLSVK